MRLAELFPPELYPQVDIPDGLAGRGSRGLALTAAR